MALFQLVYQKKRAKTVSRDSFHLYKDIEKAKELVHQWLDSKDIARAGLIMWTDYGDELAMDKNVYFATREKNGTHNVTFDITDTIK